MDYIPLFITLNNINKTFFNLERKFAPKDILEWSSELKLLNFDYIDEKQDLNLNIDLLNFNKKIYKGCGIY